MKSESLKRTTNRTFPVAMVALLLALGVYTPVLAKLGRVWWSDSYVAHGAFVPLFSAFLVWEDRAALRAMAGPGTARGGLLVLLGILLLGAGRHGGSLTVEAVSLVVVIVGFVLWLAGARCLKRAAFPLGFLLCMAPVPPSFVQMVTAHLQGFAAQFAGATLGLLAVPSYQSGVFIALPDVTLKVAEICNGLRFMFAFLVLTVAFAQVSQRRVGRKLFLIASAIPLAVAANGVRVSAIAVAAYYVGPEAASGVLHHSIGKAVWVGTFVLLVVLGWLLQRGDGRRVGRPAREEGAVVFRM